MKIGTYYYPEQWSADEWERDFDRIAALGLRIVHMGEFAWGSIEPEPGRFELEWLHRCVQLAQSRSLDVILCTPSAVVPSWLVRMDPSVLFTSERFGGRRHANHLHPLVQERVAKVVGKLASEFGAHPAVIGWQIDNELSGGFGDQSLLTHAAFRGWLKRKYGTISRLNEAWGCAFWNTFYADFDEILMPPARDAQYRNPHQNLDACRFWSWSFADFLRFQAEILRPRVGSRFITTNFMPFHPDLDPRDAAEHLTLMSWDSYPITGLSHAPNEEFRMPSPSAVAFVHDQMRCVLGRWGLMEVQPGQINWSGVPVRPMPGAIRLQLWQAIAHGCSFITVYRFRKPRFGVELWHDGLVDWDGVTLMPGGEEFAATAGEWERLAGDLANLDLHGLSPLARRVGEPVLALVHDHGQLWDQHVLPQARRWDGPRLLAQYHDAAARLGLAVDVIDADRDLQAYPVVIVPAMLRVSAELLERLAAYVRGGGHLVLGPRFGVLDESGHAPEAPYGGRTSAWIGARRRGYDSLPAGAWGHVAMAGHRHRWASWGELLEPVTAVTWATYEDQFYAGTAAVVHQKVAAGSCTLLGVADEGSLTCGVIERVVRGAGLSVVALPARTRLHRMNGLTIFLNFNAHAVRAPSPRKAKFLIGDRHVPAAGVAVWVD
jgi:beta-galactosidase